MLFGRELAKRLTGFSSLIIKRNAGHSKWANIKHTKAAKDGERAQLFVKLCQKMRVAIQEGGSSNPDANIMLAQAVDVAKKKNMPLASIQACIKNAQSDKGNQKVVWYEIKGPRGCFIIAQALVVNVKQTRDNVASILRRNGTTFADHGGRNIFEQKGIILANAPEGSTDALDKALDDAIDCGVEEVLPSEVEEAELKFLCEMKDLNIIKTKLGTKKYKIISADIDFIPKTQVELTDAEMEAVSKLMDKLEEHPDIVKLYDNIA